jgi:hypothetical protein
MSEDAVAADIRDTLARIKRICKVPPKRPISPPIRDDKPYGQGHFG